MAPEGATTQPQPLWFLLVLALASAGGAVSYVPFLTVLLPVRITEIAQGENVASLAYVTFAGANVASLANIAFGWLSDRTGTRRAWIAAGLVLSTGLLVVAGTAGSVFGLILAVMAWQVGLNMMLGPLAAWAGDCVPDEQKGLLGGLFSFAPALGALSGAVVTVPGMIADASRPLVVALASAAMVLPALLLGAGRKRPPLMAPDFERLPRSRHNGPLHSRSAILRMWLARLLVQIAEASLFAFLLFWLVSLSPRFDQSFAARLFTLVLWIAVPLALFVGRWSDRTARPIIPLVATAALSSVGLVMMAAIDGEQAAIAGYLLFGTASTIFLALHSGQTLRVLPRPQHRGRDLGLFNLTNTIPSLIFPWFTLLLVPVFGYAGLFAVLAALAALAAALLAGISRRT